MENDLQRLFVDQLRDMYDAEHRIVEALPKKIEAAQASELKENLEKHLEETKQQVKRLEAVFKAIDVEPKRNTCQATKGLIEEAQELVQEFSGTNAIDAAIICAGQKVEHYEIATYGCLCAWARELRHDKAAALLQASLQEEKLADEKLTQAAEARANVVAR